MKNNKKTVQVRGGFSERNGVGRQLNKEMQTNSFDVRTRTLFVNVLQEYFLEKDLCNYTAYGREDFTKGIYREIAQNATGELAYWYYNVNTNYAELFIDYISAPILNGKYDEVLTLIEFIAKQIDKSLSAEIGNRLRHKFNELFEQEYVGYRFLGDIITPITNDKERKCIEESMTCQIKMIEKHMEKAVKLLSNRDDPDYKNSIKESINAIEAAARFILQDDSIILSKALVKLNDKGIICHKTLRDVIEKIYAFGSDAGGVRHGEKSEPINLGFDEAKMLLVTCSSVVNFLLSKSKV